MTFAVLGLGSNVAREAHIAYALKGLAALGTLNASPVVESDPVGYDSSSRFHNLVVGLHTDYRFEAVKQLCKRLECDTGRLLDEPRFSPKTLDIDILLWQDGQHAPHPDILCYAHVLCPMALLYPDMKHPGTDQTYRALWEARRHHLPAIAVL